MRLLSKPLKNKAAGEKSDAASYTELAFDDGTRTRSSACAALYQ